MLDPCLELIRVLLFEFALGVAGSDVVENVVRLRQVEGFQACDDMALV